MLKFVRLNLILNCCPVDIVVRNCLQGNQNTLTNPETWMVVHDITKRTAGILLPFPLPDGHFNFFFEKIPFHPEMFLMRNFAACFTRGMSILGLDL